MEKRSIDEMQMQYNRDDDMPLESERGSMIIVEENVCPEEFFGTDNNLAPDENTRIIEHTIITQGEESETPLSQNLHRTNSSTLAPQSH